MRTLLDMQYRAMIEYSLILKERIEIQGFSKEEDIIEYDNYLRRLFNNRQYMAII